MNKRILAAILAAVLAVAGIAALVAYAHHANERAYDGAELQAVYQVSESVPSGTSGDDLLGMVKLVKLPKAAIARNAVSDLHDLRGLKATTELEVGEQLVATRFNKSGDVGGAPAKVAAADVPEGYQQITVPLGTARVVGGVLKAGDLVGMIASYETSTNVLRSKVLVTRVAGGPLGTRSGSGASGDSYLVTLAVTTPDAEKVVNAAEFGRLWLTLQNAKTDVTGAKRIEPADILK